MRTRLLALVSRLRFVSARRRLCDEASEELQSHFELLTARYVDSGMAPDDARLAARQQPGNVLLVREEIYHMNSVRWLEALIQDVRDASRMCVRNPAFATVVILTLALGIGANTAILSVAYSVLLKPLPYPQPDQIYSVEVVVPERRDQFPSLPNTIQAYLEWRRAQTAFSGISAVTPWEPASRAMASRNGLEARGSPPTSFRFWVLRLHAVAVFPRRRNSPESNRSR